MRDDFCRGCVRVNAHYIKTCISDASARGRCNEREADLVRFSNLHAPENCTVDCLIISHGPDCAANAACVDCAILHDTAVHFVESRIAPSSWIVLVF